MLDPKVLRDDLDRAIRGMRLRGDEQAERSVRDAAAADRQRRQRIQEVEVLRARRNEVSQAIGLAKREGRDAADEIRAMRDVARQIKLLDQQLRGVEEAMSEALLHVPNIPDERVPPGEEGSGPVLSEFGTKREGDIPPHWEIGEAVAGPGSRAPVLDLARGAKVSGSGFVFLTGGGARLSRALIQFMLDLHTAEHGYLETAPPLMVSRASLTATGHLPKFEDDVYRTDPDDLFLVPTAEVPLTSMHAGEILDGDDLPLAYVAHTPCFRREAGAAGRDTRGMLRVHQFDKVELVRLCRPEHTIDQLELLTRHAERVLELLELPYRRVLLPAGDLGFANAITYDLEVWAPGVGNWLEVSSCSSYTDFQARRGMIRFRRETGQRPELVHTLNGSALALARIIVALLENGYHGSGEVLLPTVLHPYLGFDKLEPINPAAGSKPEYASQTQTGQPGT